jgi:CopG family nickel-responsive transcriptional regulator
LIYDHTKRGLSSALTDIQHEYAHLIKSAIHIHLDHDNCLEVVILDGEGEDVKAVAERIMSLKGVTYVKLNTALPAET